MSAPKMTLSLHAGTVETLLAAVETAQSTIFIGVTDRRIAFAAAAEALREELEKHKKLMRKKHKERVKKISKTALAAARERRLAARKRRYEKVTM